MKNGLTVVYGDEEWSRVCLPFLRKMNLYMKLELGDTVLDDMATSILHTHRDAATKILNAIINNNVDRDEADLLQTVSYPDYGVEDEVTLVYFEFTRYLKGLLEREIALPSFLTEGILRRELNDNFLAVDVGLVKTLGISPAEFRQRFGF